MSISNKLKTILSLQSIDAKVKSIYKNVQKVFDAGTNADQWKAYCLKTGGHFDLPEGMTSIPIGMFERYSNLITVSIPSTVGFVEMDSFRDSGIQISQLPEPISDISMYSFRNCQNISAMVLPSSIDYVESEAFADNKNLTEVTFVKTAQKTGTPSFLEYDIFKNCPNLVTINVHWSEDDPINAGAPWGAENATINYNFWDTARNSEVFKFPPGFVKIPDYLFYDTTATTAKEIYLGDECKEIGEYSFYGDTSLNTVHFPDGLTTIGRYAFRHCTALNFSELPDSVEYIGLGAFQNVPASISKFSKNLKRIEKWGFRNNTSLTKLTFLGTPSGGIHSAALEGCTNLVEIDVPWSEDDPINAGAPWGAVNAKINYNWRNN